MLKRYPLYVITPEQLAGLLRQYVQESGTQLDLLLVGALAMPLYGIDDHATRDVDAELTGPLEGLAAFLRQQAIPADLTQNMSGWSIVAMPPGYRDRARLIIDEPAFRLRVLAPTDFIIAKLRRGTDLAHEVALLVACKYLLRSAEIRACADAALASSPQDTALFLFRKSVDLFCQDLDGKTSEFAPES